jgi:hypothetical protein
MAERKRRGADRTARRESLLVLLARARRGVALTPAEAALLFAHVEVELAEADELRRTVQGQQTAIQVMGNRAEAADAVIVEVEKDRDQARAELAELQEAEAQRVADGTRTHYRDRAEQAEQRLATYVGIFGPAAPDDFHTMQHRAKQAEAALGRIRDARTLGEALAAVAEHDGMPPETARAHGRILDQGDAVEARLAEQQRAHEIELAEQRRRGDGWRQHALDTDHKADRYRTAWFAARRDRKADRAAMAAELPLVKAGHATLDRAARARADLLAALTR